MSRFKFLVLISFVPFVLSGRSQIGAIPAEGLLGGVLFVDSGQNLGNEFSTDVALGDLDGDTDFDAFVVNSTPGSQVWINQGGEQGGSAGVYLDSGQSLNTIQGTAVSLGDVDGDTDLDAFVVLAFGTDSHQVWINQGGEQGGTAGVFQRNSHTFNDSVSTDVVLGDVDGDTDLDAYIPRIFDSDQLYLNDGTGLFTNSGQNLEPADALGADLADVDGDGDLDVYVAVQTGANKVWLNQGGVQGGTEGVFLDSGQTLGSSQSLNVALGDLDNDNDIDAFVANTIENVVWINQGGVQGGTPGVFLFNGQLLGFSASTDVQLADLDNDNDLDAFVAEFGPNTVWVNQGGSQGGTIGQFADSGLALGNQTSNGVALADVDGDNDIDAFIANSGPAPNKVYLNGSGPSPSPVNPEGWQFQLVDTRGDTGNSSVITLDSQGYPHIAHVAHIQHPNGNSYRLNHVYWDGIRWHKEFVTSAGGIGKTISIALDSNDNPHFAFAATFAPNKGLRYAYWDGSQWQTQIIESDKFYGNISLAIDSFDVPHVSYAMTEPEDEFKYAYWNGTTWHKETVEMTGNLINGFTSLALDDNDRPHIVYYKNDIDKELKYAYDNGSSWQISTIESEADFSNIDHFFSLIVPGNTPSLAYYKDDEEILIYAEWDGNSWQSQTVLAVNFPINLTGSVSLDKDSTGNPHIVYALNNINTAATNLHYTYWDSAQWQDNILDNDAAAGQPLDMVLDGNDKPHIVYKDEKFDDLRHISWDKNWQIRTLANQVASVDIQVQKTMPYLSYHNVANDLISLTHWDDSWQTSGVDSVTNPVSQLSLALTQNARHISYYDADAQALMYGRKSSSNWNIQTVDSQGNVGRYNQLVLPANQSDLTHIAYWDETNRQIKIAVYEIQAGTFTLHNNTAAPSLEPGSGPLSADLLADGTIGIAYYDAGATSLRLAIWDMETETWTDELVDNNGGDVGRLNALKADAGCGCPTIAYYDETNDVIKYAQKIDGSWLIEIVTLNVGGVSGLALELGLGSGLLPEITYVTASTSHFAYKKNNVWQFEIIANDISSPGAVALTLDSRPHITYSDAVDGLQYIFRTATLNVDTAVPGPPTPTGGKYNPLTPCKAMYDFLFGDDFVPPTTGSHRPLFGGDTSLDDDGIFEGMAMLFNQTTGGQNYIDLYFDHAPEMAEIGLDDPQLMWDGYGTLQNFLPGLEGLVTGNGDQFIVTQEMVDDALDVWTRIAAVAGPELANVINSELAQYNNLQDFVGMSFDEWAIAIGVNPPAENIYLPAVFR